MGLRFVWALDMDIGGILESVVSLENNAAVLSPLTEQDLKK